MEPSAVSRVERGVGAGRRGTSTLCVLWLPVSWLLERKCHPSLLVLSIYFKEKRNRTKTTFAFEGGEDFTILEEKQLRSGSPGYELAPPSGRDPTARHTQSCGAQAMALSITDV